MTQAYVKIEEFWSVEAERTVLLKRVGALDARVTRQRNTISSLQGETSSLERENARLKIELSNARASRDTEVDALTAKLQNAESSLRAKMNAISATRAELEATKALLEEEARRPTTTIVLPVPLTQDERNTVESVRRYPAYNKLLTILDRVCPPPAAKPAPTDAEIASRLEKAYGEDYSDVNKALAEAAADLRARGAK